MQMEHISLCKEIGRVIHHGQKSYYVDYLCNTDVEKSSITLQDGETSDHRWVEAEELRNMDRNLLATQRIQNFIEEL